MGTWSLRIATVKFSRFPLLYLKGMRRMVFKVCGFCFIYYIPWPFKNSVGFTAWLVTYYLGNCSLKPRARYHASQAPKPPKVK